MLLGFRRFVWSSNEMVYSTSLVIRYPFRVSCRLPSNNSPRKLGTSRNDKRLRRKCILGIQVRGVEIDVIYTFAFDSRVEDMPR